MNKQTPAAERTCFALDVECAVGGPRASAAAVRQWWDLFRSEVATVRPGDAVIAGASHFAAQTFAFALAEYGFLWRIGSGKDGAENAIIDSLDLNLIARRYTRLVIVSGDHRWAEVARDAKGLGLKVRVVALQDTLSARLHREAPSSIIRLRPRPLAPLSTSRIAA